MTTDFIYGDHISDLTIDNLLEFWDNCTYLKKVNGEFSDGVDPTIKKSVDMAIPPFLNEKAVRIFLGELQTVLDKYLERFPYAIPNKSQKSQTSPKNPKQIPKWS